MVLLSDLLRYELVDRAGETRRLVDFSIDPAAGDYPPVASLLLRDPSRHERELPWRNIAIDWQRRLIQVPSFDLAREVTSDAPAPPVLLRRDVLDALVLDLKHRQAARANDLWLREEGGRLWLRGADLSAWALLRRLGHGLFGHGGERQIVDWKEIEFLRGDRAAARQAGDYHHRVAQLPPAQIARLLDQLPYLHAAELLALLPESIAAQTLESMTPERQLQVFEELAPEHRGRLLAGMAPDAAADLLGCLEPGQARSELERLPEPRRTHLLDLLRYPEDSVGGIMTNEVVVVPAEMRVGEARQALADQLRAFDFVHYVYAVDDPEQRHLRGVLSLRDLLVGDERCAVAEVMNPRIETIGPLEPAHEAAQRLADAGLAALPVTAPDGRLLGAVTFDAALAQLAPPSLCDRGLRIFS